MLDHVPCAWIVILSKEMAALTCEGIGATLLSVDSADVNEILVNATSTEISQNADQSIHLSHQKSQPEVDFQTYPVLDLQPATSQTIGRRSAS